MFYLCHAWQKRVTASCSNPRFSSSVRWGNEVQRFSVAIGEMGGTCSAYGTGEAYTWFWWGNLRERDHLGEPGVDARIILRQPQEVACGGMDWIELAQDRDRWRAVVNEVMNLLWVP